MHCAAFESRLQHLLDERARPEDDDALVDHAAHCPVCREVLEVQAGVFDTVRDWSVSNLDVDLDVNLVERVLDCVAVPERVAAAKRPASSRSWIADHRRLFVQMLVAMAATVAICATIWQWRASSSAPSQNASPTPDIVSAPSDGHSQKLAAVGSRTSGSPASSVSELARGLGHRVARGMVYVQRGGFDDDLELPEPVAAGLRPIRDSMAAAIDALKRTLSLRNEQPVIRSSWRLPSGDAIA
jgi:hypothetical protein